MLKVLRGAVCCGALIIIKKTTYFYLVRNPKKPLWKTISFFELFIVHLHLVEDIPNVINKMQHPISYDSKSKIVMCKNSKSNDLVVEL